MTVVTDESNDCQYAVKRSNRETKWLVRNRLAVNLFMLPTMSFAYQLWQ